MARIALLQMNTGIDPGKNVMVIEAALAEAAAEGATMLFTPEMSVMLDQKRSRAARHIHREADDPSVVELKRAARASGIWLALGSTAMQAGADSDKWANRSLLINGNGEIVARYDKIHMFDVDLASGESWRESSAYRAGNAAVSAKTPIGQLGFAICYDLRFPALFDALGRAGCDAIALPAAFTVPTGRDHWHIMLRARAIESSCYIIAAAQVGEHEDGRATYGHSLVVDPWGKVLLDMGGEGPALGYAEIELARITEVRRQLPSLANRRKIAE